MNAQAVLLRGRRRAAPIALGLGVLTVAAIAALTLGSGENGARRATATGASTATVTRQTLVERETVDGTLGYAGSRTVINRLGSGSAPSGSDPSASPAGSDGSPVAAVPAVAFTPDPAAQGDPPAGDEPEGQDPQGDQPADQRPAGDEPEGDQPESDLPEGDQPGGDQPDGDQTDGDHPEGGQPDGNQADGGQPEGDQPGQPDGGQPEGDQPGQPDGGQPEGPSGSATPQGSRGSSPSGSDPDSGEGSGGYAGSGTVTALPRAGSVVERGGALYRLDGDPVVLMYGSVPAYRALQPGIEDGPDVRQLEENLVELGFDPGTVDETFTSATSAAVSDWQDSLGLAQTGSVELGRVVFQPGARRIGEHKTSVGSVLGAGSEVLETSSTRRVVTVELDATLQSLAKEGAGVEVTLPDGSLVRGRITDIGNVAREVESSTADPNAEKQLVVDVTVRLRSTKGIGRLDEAPVGVGLAQESRRNVLAVPVNALVARRGGGYGVELAANHRIATVETGLFADGYVEVSGPAIREGTRVVVPSE